MITYVEHRLFDFNRNSILSIVFLITVTLLSCSTKTDQASSEPTPIIDEDSISLKDDTYFDLSSYIAEGTIGNINVENIDFDCAIIIYPTEEQIEQLKQQNSDDDYNVIVDDNLWYQAQAIEFIDSANVETLATTEKFIRLKGVDKTWELDIRKRNLPAWNLILFNKNKQPVVASSADLTMEEVTEYFELVP